MAYHTVDQLKLEETLQRYQEVFQDELGTVKTPPVSLTVKDQTQPRFIWARLVPFAIKEAIGREIDRLEDIGVLEKVEFSHWATPIMPVPKSDGTFQLCGDYKVTPNAALKVDQHPLPKPEEIFASLAGGQRFTTLDLLQAYQQLVLDNASKELVTISTHQGLSQYTCLPFGVASAPVIIQRTMDQVLHGLPGVMCYLDDIIIAGATDQKHLSYLATVLERLRSKVFRLKKNKCLFMKTIAEYLGHMIDANGLHTSLKKCQAITEAPAPTNVMELRSFLGLVNYYGRFVPNLASGLQLLNWLLRKGTAWAWTKKCRKLLTESRQCWAHSKCWPTMIHPFPCQWQPMPQQCRDGRERPVAFASRTLTTSECNYSQLEKEALALIFGIKRFHRYLHGRKFTFLTDHMPLTTTYLGTTQCHSHSGRCQAAEVGNHPVGIPVQHCLQTDRRAYEH